MSQKQKESDWKVKYEKDVYDRFIEKMKDVMISRISEDKKDVFKCQVKFEVAEDK